ncbi:ankyrin repeat domain-containing protein [Tropicimonas isoalkanivorans]|uniref:Ankyrin repeat n=1 Tax=Tropicimonas isoalkanivorans TaxID=441112 RepID=A0A1I1QWC7_9RHOB|nr:ankyrin repeat domain-containing protein [Tropicimonas isoalkanivorans]SFD24178.1 Ankyrin repeat [Tropicimonas isoalkanivorans]
MLRTHARISWRTVPLFGILLAGSAATAGPLHDAVRMGDRAAVSEAVANTDDLDETDFIIGTPLHAAVAEGHADIARLLIETGADVNAVSEINGKTALHLAAELGDFDTVRLLLENEADVAARDKTGLAAIHHATVAGHPAIVTALLNAGVEVDTREFAENMTPLMIASLVGDHELVELLVDGGADIEAESGNGRTPFYYAASWESYINVGGDALLRYLANLGVDMSPEDESGLTPLTWAMARNMPTYREIVEVLIDLGVER